jgi:hypothetical protein
MTYPSLAAFLTFLKFAPPIPSLTSLDIFHDCNRVAWYWAASGMGGTTQEEKGVHLLYTIDEGMADLALLDEGGLLDVEDAVQGVFGGRKVNMMLFELDSLGWSELDGRK